MISNMIDSEGIKYSKVIQKIKQFDSEPIDKLFVARKHVFALATSGKYYFWGLNQAGLALENTNK